MNRIARIALLSVLTAGPAFAQESERVRQLEQDIQLLKSTAVEQARRIEALERELREMSSRPASTTAGTAAPLPSSQSGQPWHDRSTWGRIKNGMSEEQVASILGRPTSVKSVGGFKTLFYRGEVGGSGSVSGNVQLQDDRVWQVNVPVF